MTEESKFQTGDIFLVRSNGMTGRWVRFLIFIRYGIPFKLAYSHIESAFNAKINVSAELSGVQLEKNDRFDKKTEFTVYRLKSMTPEKQEKHKEIAETFLGKGYAFARYALDAVRIAAFYLFIAAVLFGLLGLVFSSHTARWLALAAGAIYIVINLIKPTLKRKDILTHDCTEVQSLIFTRNNLWAALPTPRNEFPDGMKQVLDNLVLHGQAEVVFCNEKK